jgi:predicted ferric reductase
MLLSQQQTSCTKASMLVVKRRKLLTGLLKIPLYLSPGLTGVLLFVVMIIIFVFAHPIIRKKAYKFFWSTHSLYVVLYILCLVHGLARLTGAPRFWLFFIGPGIIYTLDKVRIDINFHFPNKKETNCCVLEQKSSGDEKL